MTSQVADMGDELARSFFEEDDVAVANGNGVVFDENGKPVVSADNNFHTSPRKSANWNHFRSIREDGSS